MLGCYSLFYFLLIELKVINDQQLYFVIQFEININMFDMIRNIIVFRLFSYIDIMVIFQKCVGVCLIYRRLNNFVIFENK